jgi:hypothetical protein
MRRAGVRIGEDGGYILPIMVLDLTDDEERHEGVRHGIGR